MEALLGTIILRPYVFLFLACYLIGASLQFGIRPAMLFIPVGYLIALASEWSSTHWGFPYGLYGYVPATAGTEIWVLGVPFMDSLSYVFLSASSYSTALFLWRPIRKGTNGWQIGLPEGPEKPWAPILLGSLLTVFLDVIIDPVALRGDRWFLGKIYAYPLEGPYFGVPLSNFGGWLMVGFVLILSLRLLHGWEGSGKHRYHKPWAPLWGPVLYLGILVFNLTVTFWIGEITLGLVGAFLTGLLVTLGGFWTLSKISLESTPKDHEER
jgi:putative membrane protein